MKDEMDNFTERLNSHDLDKQRYHSCKIVDAFFKQFKESVGISYSIGAKLNVSSRTVLSSFDLSASPSSMFCCLAQLDLLTRNLRKPKKHMSPTHIERAKGFASHSVLQIVTLDRARLQNAEHWKAIRSVILGARRDAAVDDRISSRLESFSRALGSLVASAGSVIGLFEGIEEDFTEFDTKFARSATESWAKMRADLSAENHERTFLEVRQSVEEFRKRVLEVPGDHQVHLDPCRESFKIIEELTSSNWSEIQKETKNLTRGAASKMSKSLQSTLNKMLGGLQQAKSKLREVELRPNEGQEPSFKAMERLHAAMDCLGLKARSRELRDALAAKADLERLGFDGTEMAEMFAEAAIVAGGCVECAEVIISVAEQFSALANTFVFSELGMLSAFVSHEFSSDDNEQEEGDAAGDKGELGPAAEGCGLGEGTGEKATTEGVDTEDLFENPAEERKEEENEENEEEGSKKDEEHVDFSDRLDDGKSRDLEKDSGDDEESNEDSGDEEGDEGPEDVEEDAVTPDDAEELKPEDWGDEVDDEKQDQEGGKEEEEEEGKEDVNNAERGPDQNNDRSGTQQEKDEEKRARQPDDQTGADIESQEDDRFHDPEYKEEEIEDLDMGDDDEAGNMDDGEEDNADEDMEQEPDIERLPDFVDEVTEPEEGDKDAEAEDEARVEASENVADGEMGEKRNDDNGKDNEGAGETGDDDDAEKAAEKESRDETDGGKGKAAAGRNEENGDEEEKDAEMEDGEKETKVNRRRAEEDDFKDQAEDVDLQRDLNEENSRFDEKSDAFAHKGEDDDKDDKDAVAMDVIMAEEEKKDSVKRVARRDKPERVSDRKREVRQDLVEDSPMVVDRDSLTESMLVSRGPTNAVSNAASVRTLTAPLEDTSEDAAEIEMDVCRDFAPEHAAEWARLSAETADLARLLAEQLRLIIEPTKATRLQGDFRSGKRINMRKVIAFIASNFRKDKIWLRRTRPSRRECEVVVAVDNSASMADADARRMAFMSVATLMQGLSVLEIGRMGILRFGERCSVVHELKSSFGVEDGASVLSKFDFSDKSTGVVDLLRTARAMYGCNAASSSSGPASKLLVVVSDGRGIMNEGKAKVLEAVRATRAADVFVVFVIVEAEDSAQSILDIRVPIFDSANVLRSIESYMEHFPFPFYIILRDIRNLPQVLSDALRQWFELVSN